MSAPKRLSPNDPNSFSNPENVRVDHMHMKWNVDFAKKIIGGQVTYRLLPVTQPVQQIVFDTRQLTVNSVKSSDGKALLFKLGDPVLNFGQPLSIDVGSLFNSGSSSVEIQVDYETSPECSALQWLDAEQTAGKAHPYVFSQCEMIHARSLLPCVDTPFSKCTYTAEVTVPKALQALMSAEVSKDIVEVSDKKTNKFEQKVPIPAYLIAIAVGHIKSKKIGPRTTVWSEPEFVDASAYEFAETEEMLNAAEQLMGKYVWGVYDILVLPPSFPMGGMENPNVTFATPTLLAGDRSLANVIAHEISHSWTGNLVTNINFEHFWLNEGFTVYAERKIMSILKGEKFRQFECIGGWKSLTDCINTMKSDNPMTKLVTDLTGLDPDEFFSVVPYEKGSVFLYYLEEKVGGPAVFEPFFKHYIQENQFKSIDTDVFKKMFIDYFTNNLRISELIKDIDWDTWLYTTGMPPVKPSFDTSLADVCIELKNRWMEWDAVEPCPFSKGDLRKFFSQQITEFLAELLEEEVSLSKVQAMQTVYDFNSYKNCEIRFRWLRLCLKAKWEAQVPLVLQFVTEQGRMKYVRPLYREMYNWEEIRPRAIDHFKKTRSSMMSMSATIIAKDLHL
ncbi:leukotriene A-4 hydrolase [Folsomia candida]|uniref:Leukotriene A(4) hydrolase n=2 Tax=Folsomia candida TaxID=158441 RepID=A0A226ERH8_FOLCA|nr:leukotriene A-4 hydrolase [Folsomia candida]OXA59860.1 Leukotriene A-4 hydrolase [Folsomia candida]